MARSKTPTVTLDADLIRRMSEEVLRYPSGRPIKIELGDLGAAIALIAHLQLSLRHPEVLRNAAAKTVRGFIDELIRKMETAGYPACAECARMGDNPNFDMEATPLCDVQ
jgi:hypothetical protein